MSFISSIIESKYDFIWKSLIRPPRDIYKDNELGKEKFRMNGRNYKRTDFSLFNNRKMKLQCSYWEPYDEERICARLPVVIYLPGNSSSRCEAVPLLGFLLPMNISVFAFDFCGSGRSDGEFISLGYYEKDDVLTVINHLKFSNKVSTIGLWGRSMGGVTAILCAKELDKTNDISCIVSDSAFSSLNILIDEFVSKVIVLPQFFVDILKTQVGNIIEKKANFRIEKIEPIENLENCKNIPILFCHGLHDTFINNHHCDDLYKAYGGEKEIVMFEGEHNEKRPLHILQVISLFFYKHLKVENIVEISLAYDKKKQNNNMNTITSLYDDEDTNDIEDDMDILNNEKECKRDIVKCFSVTRPKVKNYFETI
jgi:fermentation-respiration switch protein FrsA (DUF1100 family)